jgi:hypothetical protein
VVGAPMLFARVGNEGRISVVRTPPLERFESRGSGIYDSHPALPSPPVDTEPEFLPDDCFDEDDYTMTYPASLKQRVRAAGMQRW